MRIERSEIRIPTTAETDVLDLTPEVARFLERTGISSLKRILPCALRTLEPIIDGSGTRSHSRSGHVAADRAL